MGEVFADEEADSRAVLLSELPALLSESLLALRIQLLSVGDNESDEPDPRFFDLASTSNAGSWACVTRSRRDDDRVDAECAAERVRGTLVAVGAGAGLTPFSSRCSGHGFWIACAIS